MAILRWTTQAAEDLEAICNYIEHNSPYAARICAADIVSAAEGLRKFPNRGRIVPECGEQDVREILCGKYRIIYRVVGDVVRVFAIYHVARRLDLSRLQEN